MSTHQGRTELLCIGTALVDSIIHGFDPNPVSASGFLATSGTLNPGGEAVNVAVSAAKLGLKTAILCWLGEDPAGDLVKAGLAEAGVDLSGVMRQPQRQTPVTTMFVDPEGNRKSITNLAHRWNFHPELYPEIIRSAGAIALGSLFRAPFDEKPVVAGVIKTARENGAVIYADTKLPNFGALRLEDIREELPLIDYLLPNEEEARFYTGRTDPDEMAEVFLEAGVGNVIIKLGAAGCLFRSREERWRLKGYPIRAVDATGAGDNFLAGFAWARNRGYGHPEALRFANACGAICATKTGALSALEDAGQVLRFLEEHRYE